VTYYLGIDGGGSKTSCCIGDKQSVLATVETGPSNVTRVGEDCARESIHRAILQACAAAGVNISEIRRACIGAAGAGRGRVAETIRSIAAESLRCEIDVVGDMYIALEAAFGAAPGAIVIAGTGSIAYARDARGNIARAGGWGFAVSDEGSAHWIGRAAVSSALRAIDEGIEATHLLQSLMRIGGQQSIDDFVHAANGNADLAALFPAVESSASGGQPVAQRVLADAGIELAQLAAIVLRRLFPDDDSVPLGMVGGVFRHSSHVREAFYNEIRKSRPRVKVCAEIVEPVHGALNIARRQSA